MNSDRDFETTTAEWLNAGSDATPPHVIDAVLLAARSTPQERDLRIPWKTPNMNKFLTIGLGAAAVVVVLLVGAQLLGSPSGNVGGPGETQSAAPSEAPSSVTPSSSAAGSLPVGFHVMNPVPPPNNLNDDQVTVTIPAAGWFAEPDEGSVTKDLGGDDRVWVEVVFQDFYRVPRDICDWENHANGGSRGVDTADQLVAALTAMTYDTAEGPLTWELSTPVDITIDGYPGQSITGVMPGDPSDCDEQRFCSVLDRNSDGCLLSHRVPNAVVTFWIVAPSRAQALDAQAGNSPRVVAASYLPTTGPELLAEMNAIVESMTPFADE